MLGIQEITTGEGFASFRPEWEALLPRARAANIFLTFDWADIWWRHYGGGRRLLILAALEGRELVGLAPLIVEERRIVGMPVFRRIRFIGGDVADRLDILLALGREQEALAAMVAHLQGVCWDMIDLHEIPEESLTTKFLPEAARRLGARVEVMPQSVCLVVRLAPDPEAHFATFGKRHRRNLSYYQRRLRREHDVAVDFVKGGPGLSDALGAFDRLYRRCFAGRAGAAEALGETFGAFRWEVAARLAGQGRLLVSLIRLDGTEAAAEMCFLYRGTCYGYNYCQEPALKRECPGTVLRWEILQHLIAMGCREYDFLRGEEAYKYRWRVEPRRQVRIRITRETRKLRLLESVMRLLRSRQDLKVTGWLRRLLRL